MALEFQVLEASMLVVLLLSVGAFGLGMCREMLLLPTASDLRREAATSMLTPESLSKLSLPQRAAVFRALSVSGERSARSMALVARSILPAPSHGYQMLRKPFIERSSHV